MLVLHLMLHQAAHLQLTVDMCLHFQICNLINILSKILLQFLWLRFFLLLSFHIKKSKEFAKYGNEFGVILSDISKTPGRIILNCQIVLILDRDAITQSKIF